MHKATAPVISKVRYEDRPIYTVLKRIIFHSSKSLLNSDENGTAVFFERQISISELTCYFAIRVVSSMINLQYV